jgi:phage-related baseplate assembly protein
MVTVTAIDVDNLPTPEVIEEVDFEAILAATAADLVDRFPAIAGVIELESEPARKLLEVDAFRETLMRARINDAMRSQLLAFSTGGDLDHLAAFYDVIRLDGEADERLRSRVIFTIAGRSPGGTAMRYRSIAMSVSVDVRDAIAYRSGVSPVVNIAVFSHSSGGIPSAELLAEISDTLNSKDVRMVNDTILVRSAVAQSVPVSAKVWLLPTSEFSVFEGLGETLVAAFEAEAGLGFDLTHSWITARLMQPGVQRVEILSPSASVVADEFEALSLGDINLTYEGRDI